MAKRITSMEKREIIRRLRLGYGIREISRDTGFSRNTVRQIRDTAEKNNWIDGIELPSEDEITRIFIPAVIPHPLDEIQEKIEGWCKAGYTYVVMTRLINELGYKYKEVTMRRYVKKKFRGKKHLVIRRYFAPGEAGEVDFGHLGNVYDEVQKKVKKLYLFSLRLNYSRKGYRETVFSQKAETFFNCHMHGFEYFGGVPQKVVCDNLKAAITKASLEEPEVNRSYRMMAEHYGFLINACGPGKPEHKGGVEKDIDYVKRNFWPVFVEKQKQLGREIPYYQDCVKALEEWTWK